MIVYALRCAAGHSFDAWFRNSDAFDSQAAQGIVTCPECGSHDVDKALMTPRLGKSSRRETAPMEIEQAVASAPQPGTPSTAVATVSAEQLGPAAALRRKLMEVRQIIEQNFDDVGSNFAEEARRIHYRETDPRGIFGTTTPDDAEALREEGIEFGSLPWVGTDG